MQKFARDILLLFMKRLTKIVATIGPAADSKQDIENLIDLGVDIFRFNFKHNIVDWHDERLKRVSEVSKKMGRLTATLLDLQGPEIRINMGQDEIALVKDEEILFGEEALEKIKKGFSISHQEIIPSLKVGQKITADDGTFIFTLTRKNRKTYLKSHSEGILQNKKTLNISGISFPFPTLTKRDIEGLKLAKKRKVDFIALSFVRSFKDIHNLKNEMDRMKISSKIVAKIETRKALEDLDKIISETDAVMVARGDLGVELDLEQVPYYQKLIIGKSIEKSKPVITATEMLQSMVFSPRPTRAEVSDVANATYDFTDCVMLSTESASGKYPSESVCVMRKTVEFNEKKLVEDTRNRFSYNLSNIENIICDAAYDLYLHLYKKEEISGFIVFTYTGKTARILSSFRPKVPIYAFCPKEEVAKSLSINYGVYPYVQGDQYKKKVEVANSHVLAGMKYLLEEKIIQKGKRFIILHGDYWAVEQGTSTIKIIKSV